MNMRILRFILFVIMIIMKQSVHHALDCLIHMVNWKEFVSYQHVVDNLLASRSSNKWKRKSSKRSEEHTSELQSRFDLVCRLLLEKKHVTSVKINHVSYVII